MGLAEAGPITQWAVAQQKKTTTNIPAAPGKSTSGKSKAKAKPGSSTKKKTSAKTKKKTTAKATQNQTADHQPKGQPHSGSKWILDGGDFLECRNLVKIYKKRAVVNEVSFNIRQGEIVGLLGPNGAGKSTSFYMAVGFVVPESGNILLNGKDITAQPMHRRARLGIGYLTQEASIFRKLTVAENLESVLETLNLSRTEIEKRRDALLEELDIRRVANQKAYTLSGGERRRTEIARALTTQPNFILLDEPFAGVDPIAVKDIQTVVKSLRERGLGILITDHNVRETLKITDRTYIMFSGQILKEGTSEELAQDDEVKRIYLGDDFTM